MEQFARRPLTRRHYFPQHTAFLLREGNAKFGHGKSPSPQTTLRSEKENRPGSTCQSKIAKLLGGSRGDLTLRTPVLTLLGTRVEAETTGTRRAGDITLNVGCLVDQ